MAEPPPELKSSSARTRKPQGRFLARSLEFVVRLVVVEVDPQFLDNPISFDTCVSV